jgi:RNA polymerase sigma-70 factor (ECF subfamily)
MKTIEIDDLTLIRRFQGGDQNAINSLIDRYSDRTYKFAYRLSGNPDDAADIAAEAFVRIYKAAATFKGQSAFSTWLYRVVTNCFLDMKKKATPRASLSLEAEFNGGGLDIDRHLPDLRPSPLVEAETSAIRTKISAAVERLPQFQREMIQMYHSDMLSYEEIAEILDLPLGTVKSRLNRARLSLRNLLCDDRELFLVA